MIVFFLQIGLLKRLCSDTVQSNTILKLQMRSLGPAMWKPGDVESRICANFVPIMA